MENTSGTVNKAIDVLEIFIQNDGELSLTELARLTGFNRATVYRLVSTLSKRGFLHQRQRNGKYSLGLKMFDCSFAIRRNLKFIDLAYMYLGKLSTEQNVAVNLTILDSDKSLLIEEIGISSRGLPISDPVSKRLPLHATACGKVLLAYMSENDRKAFYGRNLLQGFTSNTITDISRLEKEMEVIRIDGVALDTEDYKIGLWAIAAPIFNSSESVIAAVSIIMPPAHTDAHSIQYFTTAIKSCTRELNQAIGRIN